MAEARVRTNPVTGRGAVCALALALLAACSSGTSSGGADATLDPGIADAAEVADDVRADVPGGEDTPALPDATPDAALDAPPADADDDAGPDAADATAEVQDPNAPPYARHVNPFIGTGGGLANVGSTLPGATAPLGLVKVSPDTAPQYGDPPAFQHCGGYRYEDFYITGFSHNHLHGTGVPDYGDVAILPVAAPSVDATTWKGRKAPFGHDGEEAAPGYYTVTLSDPHVRVELTATTRCAHHRYEFLDGAADGHLAFDAAAVLGTGRSLGGSLTVDAASGTIEGHNWHRGEFSGRYNGFDVFFTARFDRPFDAFQTWSGAALGPAATVETSEDPAHFGAFLTFATATDPTVEVQVCLSYVDLDGAKAAQAAELPGWDFEGTRAATEAAWEAELNRFEVKGGTADDRANFYTAVYHVLQMPTIWSDVDGRYLGFDRKAHAADGWTYYTDLSLWDTFRTQHPLIALVWPQRQRDMIRSLGAMIEQGGYVPKWPMGAGDTGSMIGEHAATVIADSWLKGIQDYDIEPIYEALKRTADGPLPAGAYGERSCIDAYIANGFCPADVHGESVSLTLEYAFNDYCLAGLAGSLGRTDDQARWLARADGYKDLFDSETQFFRGRNTDGSWTPLDAEAWLFGGGDYVEGTAWQWLWFAPHDEAGLRALFGSDASFLAKLTDFFVKAKENFLFELPSAWYFHGNEPDLHAPFLFAGAGRADLGQQWARWVLETNYRNAPDGMVGNDDAGTLAAWYVFVAVGLYPWPCFPGYYVTTPLFDEATVHLPGGDLIVKAPGAGAGKTVISKALWNGQALDRPWLDHQDLVAGGVLELELVAPAAGN